MTVSTTTSRITYSGDGVSTVFAVPFIFFGSGEIQVVEKVTATGVETTKTLTTDYSVTGGNGETGSVTAVSAPASGVTWTIARNTNKTQLVDYVPNDPFPAATHERALDRLTCLVQELADAVARAAKLSVASVLSSLTLPDPSADTYLGWKSDLSGLENKTLPTGTAVYSSIANTRTGSAAAEAVTPDGLASLWQKGADIASAATLAKPADANLGGYHVVTGSVGISAFWTGDPVGTEYEFRFSGGPVITHSANFILPLGANVTAVAGDVIRLRVEQSSPAIVRVVTAPPTWFPPASLDVLAKTATYTANNTTDKGKVIRFTTSSTILNLPAVSGNAGLWYWAENAAASGDVTLDPNASETLDGLATRLLRPGDRVLIYCDGAAWETLSGAYSFKSAEQTPALSTVLSVAHGLGVKPNFLRAVFRCKTAEGGWAVGDEIDYNSVVWSYGAAVAADATNAVATCNQTYTPGGGDKTTGVGFDLTYAKWKLVFYAKDIRG